MSPIPVLRMISNFPSEVVCRPPTGHTFLVAYKKCPECLRHSRGKKSLSGQKEEAASRGIKRMHNPICGQTAPKICESMSANNRQRPSSRCQAATYFFRREKVGKKRFSPTCVLAASENLPDANFDAAAQPKQKSPGWPASGFRILCKWKQPKAPTGYALSTSSGPACAGNVPPLASA